MTRVIKFFDFVEQGQDSPAPIRWVDLETDPSTGSVDDLNRELFRGAINGTPSMVLVNSALLHPLNLRMKLKGERIIMVMADDAKLHYPVHANLWASILMSPPRMWYWGPAYLFLQSTSPKGVDGTGGLKELPHHPLVEPEALFTWLMAQL